MAEVGLVPSHPAPIVKEMPLARLRSADKKKRQGECAMSSTVMYAFVVVAISPLVGIWRAHAWAKKNGFVLRDERAQEQDQLA